MEHEWIDHGFRYRATGRQVLTQHEDGGPWGAVAAGAVVHELLRLAERERELTADLDYAGKDAIKWQDLWGEAADEATKLEKERDAAQARERKLHEALAGVTSRITDTVNILRSMDSGGTDSLPSPISALQELHRWVDRNYGALIKEE